MNKDVDFLDIRRKCCGLGLEVGWHLRYSKGDHLRVLALKEARGELENILYILPIWRLSITEVNDHIQADYTRKKNVYEPD